MKTLADFKRALTLGSKWECTHAQSGSLGIREVALVKSNCVGFHTDKGSISYLYFPKSSEFEINSKGEAEIYWAPNPERNEPRTLVLTYLKVEE